MEDTFISDIQQAITKTIHALGFSLLNYTVTLERPAHSSHGDYATSCALALFSLYKTDAAFLSKYTSPRKVAEACVQELEKVLTSEQSKQIASITIAGPGFINITLSESALIQRASLQVQGKLINKQKTSQKYIIEYVSPNTNKPLHIGHLRNAALGMALANILQACGATVTKATVNNDRGLHIMKSVWGYLVFAQKGVQSQLPSHEWKPRLTNWCAQSDVWLQPTEMDQTRLHKSDHFVGYWYTKADSFAEDTLVQAAWSEMLQAWEDVQHEHHRDIRAIWQHMNAWFYAGYSETAQRFGFSFDQESISYESELYQAGKELVLKGVRDGIFKTLSDGATMVALDRFTLPDKVLLRKDGTGIYMTFDIELTRQRSLQDVDRMIWVVGTDQKLYFQQLFAVAELLGYGNRDRFHHFAYGMVRLPDGKMSSRKGRVIYGDDLLTEACRQAQDVISQALVAKLSAAQKQGSIVSDIGIGAVKWTMLSQDPESEIIFNLKESTSIKGFSGPYIQYTHARTQSLLETAKNRSIAIDFDIVLNNLIAKKITLGSYEKEVLRYLFVYSDFFERAAAEYAPHYLCQYLFTLAQQYNTLYAEVPILSNNTEQQNVRLCITQAVASVLQHGLTTLGIAAPERM